MKSLSTMLPLFLALGIFGEIWTDVTVDYGDWSEPVLRVERTFEKEQLSFEEPFTLEYPGRYQILLWLKHKVSDSNIGPVEEDLEGLTTGVVKASISIENSFGDVVFSQDVSEEFDPELGGRTMVFFMSNKTGTKKPLVLKFELSEVSGNLFSERESYSVKIIRSSRFWE